MYNATRHHLPTLRGLAATSALIAGLILCTSSPLWAANQPRQHAAKPLPSSRPPLNPKQIFQRVSPFLLTILTYDSDGQPVSQGSAFLIAPTFAITNLHVLKYAKTAVAKSLNEGLSYPIQSVLAFSRRRDLCVLVLGAPACKATGSGGSGPSCGLPIRPSSGLGIGDEIFVAGTPQGLEGTFSRGMVTGVRNEPKLLQIDAPISPGSSGGPVLNTQAEVVGVVVSTLSDGQNLNFAIPIQEITSLHDHSVDIPTAGGIAVYDKESQGLRGRVKSVRLWSQDYAFDQLHGTYYEEPAKVEMLTTFDQSGNQTRMGVKNLDTGAVTSVCSSFDADDFLVEMGCDSSSAPYPQASAIFVMGRTIIGKEFTLPVPPSGSLVVRYSSRGLQEMMVTDTPDFYEKALSYFDAGGREIEKRVFGRNGELKRIVKSTYQDDSAGNWIGCDDTRYSPKFTGLGFIPDRRVHREVAYYGD